MHIRYVFSVLILFYCVGCSAIRTAQKPVSVPLESSPEVHSYLNNVSTVWIHGLYSDLDGLNIKNTLEDAGIFVEAQQYIPYDIKIEFEYIFTKGSKVCYSYSGTSKCSLEGHRMGITGNVFAYDNKHKLLCSDFISIPPFAETSIPSDVGIPTYYLKRNAAGYFVNKFRIGNVNKLVNLIAGKGGVKTPNSNNINMQRIKEIATHGSIAGTTWELFKEKGLGSFGYAGVYKFKVNGDLYWVHNRNPERSQEYNRSKGNFGTWRQDGDKIYFEVSKKFREYVGLISGSRMKGESRLESKPFGSTWEAEKCDPECKNASLREHR